MNTSHKSPEADDISIAIIAKQNCVRNLWNNCVERCVHTVGNAWLCSLCFATTVHTQFVIYAIIVVYNVCVHTANAFYYKRSTHAHLLPMGLRACFMFCFCLCLFCEIILYDKTLNSLCVQRTQNHTPTLWDPSYWNGSMLLQTWISNYIHYKVWNMIFYPLP